uniref:Lysosome-associated membrane glycoprotein 1 n=2 Tax=Colobus angolensis palliatus TaxID=336983 RepID=A0A2K5KDV6_COLAP
MCHQLSRHSRTPTAPTRPQNCPIIPEPPQPPDPRTVLSSWNPGAVFPQSEINERKAALTYFKSLITFLKPVKSLGTVASLCDELASHLRKDKPFAHPRPRTRRVTELPATPTTLRSKRTPADGTRPARPRRRTGGLGVRARTAAGPRPPDQAGSQIKTVESITDIRADIDKKYRCVSGTQVRMNNVTVTLHDATIQAYLSNSNFSREETRCEQDRPSPTTAPPPAPPSPSPSPVPENPSVDKYNVSGTNGTCLLASMGLQLNLTYERKDNTTVTRLLNINPNKTLASGSCGAHLVTLELHSEGTTVLLFQFGMNASSSRFFLQGIQLNTTLPDARDPAFKAANGSLRALQATVGNSYKCNAEEHVRVTKAFSVNIFKVWVQAFKVEGGQFGSVEECLLDENNMLIPIAVGGALAGLVLIVLIAYLVGRKRSHAGYQTI